jgi:hypothetical protein
MYVRVCVSALHKYFFDNDYLAVTELHSSLSALLACKRFHFWGFLGYGKLL